MKASISPLRHEREKRGWSRPYVEARTEGRISQVSLERWEEGKAFPRSDNIDELCKLYGKNPEELALVKSYDIMGTSKSIYAPQEGIPMSDIMRRAFFSDLGSRLSSLVNAWPRRNLDYQDLQAEINQAITDYDVAIKYDSSYAVTRRDTCKSLMLIPLRLCGLDAAMQTVLLKIPKDIEGLLLHTAAGIAAAWHMRRTKDVRLAYEAVSYYIPILESVQSSSSEKYRKAAAKLLIQCFMLQGPFTRDILDESPVPYYERAMEYALLVEAPREQAIIHREIAYALWRKEDYSQALIHAEQAYHCARNVDGTIQSYALSNLMYCQAATGNADEALSSLDKAQKLFNPTNLPITIMYSSSILAICVATTQRHLGNYKEAATFYTQSIEAPDTSVLGKLDALIDRATVEACRDDKPRDMDLAVSHLEQAIIGAKELGSERFIKDARRGHPLLVAAWPREESVKKLRRHLQHKTES